ncbi:MAG: 1-deoxy-D-xylulose-5-phosphate reductoisomerase [Candidatus Micrarchaeaceae archaeon]|jgi:1-deoxy-D-xylulose-5-phosphate reductoisomerase
MEELKGLAIAGSTGSIGRQTLEVVKEQGGYRIVALTCNSRIDILKQQIIDFQPDYAAVTDEMQAEQLKRELANSRTKIVSGIDNAIDICLDSKVDRVVNAIVGIAGLRPTLRFLEEKDVALANKESLVTGSHLIQQIKKKSHKKVILIDSEHNAIHQIIRANPDHEIRNITITASGGPFWDKDIHFFDNITVEQALNHPTWKMGGRITIDSATLMNKGFEVIEAYRAFPLTLEQIKVLIHPTSTVHALVEFVDGCTFALLSKPDMKLHIQDALYYPARPTNNLPSLNLAELKKLEFIEPDLQKFPCLELAHVAVKMGGTALTVLNAADEVSIELFFMGRIKFMDIPKQIEKELIITPTIQNPSYTDIMETDRQTRTSICSRLNVPLRTIGQRKALIKQVV